MDVRLNLSKINSLYRSFYIGIFYAYCLLLNLIRFIMIKHSIKYIHLYSIATLLAIVNYVKKLVCMNSTLYYVLQDAYHNV